VTDEQRRGRVPPQTADELDARRSAILDAVVAEYVGTGQPVGSAVIARTPGIDVSPATVRSEMAALEHDGYVAQPHTSAGRIPTDKGYRFFVDHLGTDGALGSAERHMVRDFFAQVHGEMEEIMERASGLLSDLTLQAAVVVAPTHERSAVRSVQLVGLGPRLGLLVVVLADGAVEKRSIDFDDDVADELLSDVSARLQAHLRGATLGRTAPPAPRGDDKADRLVARSWAALEDLAQPEGHEHVFVGGGSRLAAGFDAVETIRSVLAILEQQLVVVTLLRDVLDSGLSVAIGSEHGFEPLASCAVVVAPLSVRSHDAGAVGIVGPTRMNYPQALAAAHVVGQRLGERLDATGSTDGEAAVAGKGGRRGGS
jgi:heat-inducible transcriptional repressor